MLFDVDVGKKKSSALGREYCCCWTVLGLLGGELPPREEAIAILIDVAETGEVAVVRGSALEEGAIF